MLLKATNRLILSQKVVSNVAKLMGGPGQQRGEINGWSRPVSGGSVRLSTLGFLAEECAIQGKYDTCTQSKSRQVGVYKGYCGSTLCDKL